MWPEALERISFWWGDKDRVVDLNELRITEETLGARFPVRTFPEWGHYPMIDDPKGWVREVKNEVAKALTSP